MNITITIDGTDPKEAFKAGAFWREYNKHCSKCGCCGSENIMPVHRDSLAKSGPNAGKRFDQFEATCCDCGATFGFGQKQDERKSLFPGKKNKQSGEFEQKWSPPYSGSGGYNSGSNAPDDDSPPF